MASNPAFRSSLRSERTIPPPQSRTRSSKAASSRRTIASSASRPPHSNGHNDDNDADLGRVRVAVRLRPRNAEDLSSDVDFSDCVELQPELNRLKLRRNNWSSESFKFDEVLTQSASQKRVYEAVAKPVVEGGDLLRAASYFFRSYSVLDGYNGTVMAYGQTGTGKTYTLGRLGKEDPSERGIMVRALEDIIAGTSPSDTVAISYMQLYLESVQDLLAPEKNNIPIAKDPKTGEVSLPGASVIKVRDLDHCLQLLEIGEANRHAANTRLNTESSRSHAILMVYIQKPVRRKVENELSMLSNNTQNDFPGDNVVPVVMRSKLLIVDLAGSERVDKSGSEGHMFEEAKFINLSLTSLGKCINSLAENSPHIPTRESKLTRLLRDSFGGTARTSLVVTIWPSSQHHAETASTIMFGQRAMKVVNAVKLKEEFDYESHSRNLECQVDYLTVEIERLQMLRETDKELMQKKVEGCESFLVEVQKSFAEKFESLEKENICLELENKNMLDELNLQKDHNERMCDEVAQLELSIRKTEQNQLDYSSYQKVLADTTQMYEKKIAELIKQIEDEHSHSECVQDELAEVKIVLSDHQRSLQVQDKKEIDELELKLKEMYELHEKAVNEVESLKTENEEILSGKEILYEELQSTLKKLSDEEKRRKCLEDEVVKLKKLLSENSFDVEGKRSCLKENCGSVTSGHMSLTNSNQSRETISSQRGTVTKIFEEVGLQKILSLLRSEDLDVQIHAVKVVANLAAEDVNQEKIVEEGGVDALLQLLESSRNTTIQRVASGAIANLAMNEVNQGLIMSKGGARLLAIMASKTDDPQTLRMVAGAIANLCGNEKLHVMLKDDGGTKALLGMVRCGHHDVIAQVARGMANFAKCESRGVKQGNKKGRSFLIEDGALTWMVDTSNTTISTTRRHIELALCHLAQNEDNAQDFISSGALKELIHISHESSREDIRNLARKALKLNPMFLAYM